mmetsp:Transcript_34836/g.31363  ORF Transcript_34836/g.31363 Transcript_34836/m.31363 type:complete len:115 (-) Transcript_34836:163-507(-)
MVVVIFGITFVFTNFAVHRFTDPEYTMLDAYERTWNQILGEHNISELVGADYGYILELNSVILMNIFFLNIVIGIFGGAYEKINEYAIGSENMVSLWYLEFDFYANNFIKKSTF